MEIKILGPGCPNCITLEKLVRNAVTELDIKANIIKVTDILEIMSLAIISTPGLIIDDKIVLKFKAMAAEQVSKHFFKITMV